MYTVGEFAARAAIGLGAHVKVFDNSTSRLRRLQNSLGARIFTSVIHSGWWAIATLTTVGYGDVYPITMGGRIFTFFILLIGVGVVTVPAGLVASALSKAREIEEEEKIKKSRIT